LWISADQRDRITSSDAGVPLSRLSEVIRERVLIDHNVPKPRFFYTGELGAVDVHLSSIMVAAREMKAVKL